MEKRVVLLTGASSGIGLAIAKSLLALGYRVIGIARYKDKKPIQHPSFTPVVCDLSCKNDLQGLLKMKNDFLDVDTAIFCAGQGVFGNLEELDLEDLSPLMQLNSLSPIAICKMLLPNLKKKPRSHLIFIGSEAALCGKRKGSFYCASKFALRGFAQALRDECSTSSVFVQMIHPGMVRTPFFDTLSFEPAKDAESALTPEDVAKVCLDLLHSSLTSHIDEVSMSPKKNCVVFKQKKNSSTSRHSLLNL